uniref:(northern house mosquito) hypothetical protein n=1 Tax=Culex pipiens TaxID=7175 RepID=A0A8D8A5Q4_CULPI
MIQGRQNQFYEYFYRSVIENSYLMLNLFFHQRSGAQVSESARSSIEELLKINTALKLGPLYNEVIVIPYRLINCPTIYFIFTSSHIVKNYSHILSFFEIGIILTLKHIYLSFKILTFSSCL